ncbi:MAG: lysophospholipid acyltransferase family protein [Planctomycetes bacterium]|nr:lysophospholipid acyltransferase family protein [Planctomycetota bacterium]
MASSVTASGQLLSAEPPREAKLGWWEHVSLVSVRFVAKALLACVSLRGLYRFARAFGTLEWLLDYRRRRRFARALSEVLGETPTAKERRRATREFFMQSRCDKLFYLVFDCIKADQGRALFSISNRRLLDEAVARGRGVYVAMSHHGALHIVAMLLTLQGYKAALVRDGREAALRRYVQNRLESSYPELGAMRVIFADQYPRPIYRCFRDGYMLGSALDVSRVRHSSQKMEWVEIFGKKRPFLTGPMRIALRCGAPVLQGFVVPESDFRYRLEIVEMLVDSNEISDEGDAVARAIPVYAANVERHVRAWPSLLTRI